MKNQTALPSLTEISSVGPPDRRSRSRSRLGNGGSASQTPPPRHRAGRGDGYRPASCQGSGTSTRTRHHDPHDQRPARRRGKIQIRLALSGMGLVSCAPNIFGGLRVETMTQTEPPAAGDGPRCRARRRSGAAGDGRQRGRNEVEKMTDGTTSRSNSRRRTKM